MNPRLAVTLRAAGVRRGDTWVLRGINWQLEPGERWALLGENGAGKTQLLKLLSGDIWPTPTRAGAAPRCYRAGGHLLELIDAKRRMAYLGGELQDKYARYGWNLRVRDVVATGLHRTDLLLAPVTRAQAGQVSAMLRACGIKRLAAREFLSLSYGEKRLALLARALVQRPDWLLLDEVYNGLDREYRGRIDSVLAAARAQGQSWIATAHRAMDVPPGTRSLIELSEGRIRRMTRLSARGLRAPAGRRAGIFAPRIAAAAGTRQGAGGAGTGAAAADRCRSLCRTPGGAARAELAVAARRALGNFRRERRRKIQFSETAVRRFVPRAGRKNRAGGLSHRHAPSSSGSGARATSRPNCKANMPWMSG